MNECMEIDKQAAVSVIVLTYGNFERLSATLDSICIQHQAIDKIIVSFFEKLIDLPDSRSSRSDLQAYYDS